MYSSNNNSLSTRKWLPYLLPSHDKEASVLRESGVSLSASSSPSKHDASVVSSTFASNYGVDPPARPPLRRLLDETADLIESPMFTHVLTLLLDATFSQMTDWKIRSDAYKLPPLRGGDVRIEDITDHDTEIVSVKLANILAVLTREAHNIGRGVPNEYVQALEGVHDLEAFAAVIYGSDLHAEASNITPPSTPGLQPLEKADLPSSSNKFIDYAAETADAAWVTIESGWGKLVR